MAEEKSPEEKTTEDAPKTEEKAPQTPEKEGKEEQEKALKKEEAPEAPAESATETEEEQPAEEPKETPEEPQEPEIEGDFVMAGVALKPGLTVRIHQRITEGEKSRIQVFEGMILGLRGDTPETKTVLIRKIASGVGVEKIFPLNLPTIEKVEVVKEAKVRRSKLYYLRDYKKKLQETLLS